LNIINILKKIPNIESLKKKILITFFILLIYRIGAHIPTPGVDTVALSEFFKSASGTILSFVNMFSGGALSKLTVFALGVMPFISASIIMQLLTASFPSLEKLAKEEIWTKKDYAIYSIFNFSNSHSSVFRNSHRT